MSMTTNPEAPDFHQLETQLRTLDSESNTGEWDESFLQAADALASLRARAEQAERDRDKWREDYITVNAALADQQEARDYKRGAAGDA